MILTKDRAVFKWLSKVTAWLRLPHLGIGLRDSRQFFNQWEAKPKPIAPCTRDFLSRFERVSGNRYEFWLVHGAVCSCCDWSRWLFWFWFFDSHLKTALLFMYLLVCLFKDCHCFLLFLRLGWRLIQKVKTKCKWSEFFVWNLHFFYQCAPHYRTH